MGRDYEFVAYLGPALSDEQVDRLVSDAVPRCEHFRHSLGPSAWADDPSAALADLHCIAIYEPVLGRPGRAFPEDKLETMRELAARPDRSLSEVVQGAWTLMRDELARSNTGAVVSDDANPMLELARRLSAGDREAFWLSRGDHSCVGGYARFRDGTLIEPSSIADVYTATDYVGGPERQWSTALAASVTLDDIVARYFADDL
jgi:uncharacterized small protein (TIGR04563 family)